MRNLVAVLLVPFLFVAHGSGSVIISLPVQNSIDGLGGNEVSYLGQTFVDPAGNPVLNEFDINAMAEFAPAYFYFNISAWNGTTNTVVGSPLFASALQTTPQTYPNFAEVTFLPNITLSPGSDYIAWLDASNFHGGYGTTLLGGNYSNAYTSGALATDFSYAPTDTWIVSQNGQNTAFNATFSPVPEPATFSVIIVAVACATLGRQGLGRRSS